MTFNSNINDRENFAENASFKHMDSRKISEDERFFDIVMHSKNPTSRREALDRINDDVLLSYISLHSTDSKVREKATQFIKDRDITSGVAKTQTDENSKRIAERKLNALNSDDIPQGLDYNDIEYEDLAHIDNDKILYGIVLYHSKLQIRRQAIEKIRDQSILFNIAKSVDNPKIAEITTKNIINEDFFLADIVKNQYDDKVRFAAVRNIKDDSLLVDIVMNNPNVHVRSEAIRNISDESVLVDVAINDPNKDVRYVAVQKIKSEKILRDIVKHSSDDNISKIVEGKLNQLTNSNHTNER